MDGARAITLPLPLATAVQILFNNRTVLRCFMSNRTNWIKPLGKLFFAGDTEEDYKHPLKLIKDTYTRGWGLLL